MGIAILWLGLAAAWAGEPRVFIKARASAPGEAMLIVVTDHDPKTAPSGRFAEVPLMFFKTSSATYAAFAALDLDVSTGPRPLRLELRSADGSGSVWDNALIIEEKSFPTQELKVEENFVNPKKKDARRAKRDSSRLRALFRRVSERYFMGSFVSPVPGASSARFGERRVFNGVAKAPHSGADLRAANGTVVRAPAAGKVALAGPLFYQGNTVILDHGLGLFSIYAHLSAISVKKGQLIAGGETLGLVGATGRVTGPHLHWAVKFNEARVDPFSLVALDLDAWLSPR